MIIKGYKRRKHEDNRGPRVNRQIRIREIRVVEEYIDEQGHKARKQLGIMSPEEALKIAQSKGLDLVEIAPNAKPPVCLIVDYGKYKYEQSKKEKEARKKQHATQLKELKLRPHIDQHDLEIKVNQIKEFLEEGHKVKISMRFFGREMLHKDLGEEILNKIVELLKDHGKLEGEIKKEGNQMLMYMVPAKGKHKKQ
jgi:translation initiation factor IF-3